MGYGRVWVELSQGELASHPRPRTPALNRGTKLVTTDGKKTVIAEFHRAHHFTRKEKAKLEIQPAGMDMLDHIVLTWVFAESKRRDRETRAKAASSSGGGGGG